MPMSETMGSDKTRALVVGYGSIGRRHARLLTQLNCDIAIVSSQEVVDYPVYPDVIQAVNNFHPGYVVICNRTSEHYQAYKELERCGYSAKVLIEKPVFDHPGLPFDTCDMEIAVGYNLRFDPVITKLRELIEGKRLLMVSVAAGQHLDEWRPGTDYRNSYSASRAEGGGVLRDLSHELDYCLWLFGKWSRLSAVGGNYGALEIEADELWSITAEGISRTIFDIKLSYLDRPGCRNITINTDCETIYADLVTSTIEIDGSQVFRSDHSYDQSYLEMHTAMLRGDRSRLCSIEEGMSTLDLIDHVEIAGSEQRWSYL